MKNTWITVAAIGALAICLIGVGSAAFAVGHGPEISNGTIRVGNRTEADFPFMARVSPNQAVRKALASVNGQFLKAELEDEDGFLVYNIEIVTAEKTIMEVKVDAGSGDVLAMEKDTPDREDDDRDGDNEE